MHNSVEIEDIKKCSVQYILAVNDTLNVISGKWKLPIIGSLLFGTKRFKELQRDISSITPRMLSKELKELEINSIVKRTVYDTIPVRVEYELTESGFSLNNVLEAMVEWGVNHREMVINN
ncbi:MAG TPA: helix-turn-helix domain-containing protein [Flavobacteriaceae bacterium]|jgi:DNA-binding HxlR family transcriptional regulator|nr:helix-turn-helix transcriptional regulator [Flavobacteriaceae bacterium]HEX5743356.1 helix-turn-helix domain-containing protein [Flavobacteriaceae bacterium]